MRSTKIRNIGVAVLRIALGWGFLYAGLSKLFQIGATGPFDAAGFLKFGTAGTWPGAAQNAVINPTHQLWVDLAGNTTVMPIVNALVVSGEILIGLALILGLVTRFAALAGTLMMFLFYVASWDFGHGFINEQFMYGAAAAILGLLKAGEVYGIDSLLERASLLKRAPALGYLLG